MYDLRSSFDNENEEIGRKCPLMESDSGLLETELMFSKYLGERKLKNEPLSYDTKEFRTLIEKYVYRAKRSNMLNFHGRANGVIDFLIEEHVNFKPQNFSTDERALGMLNLSVAGKSKALAQLKMEYFIINPRSKNKALALEFIVSFIGNLSEMDEVKLFKSRAEPVLNSSFEGERLELEDRRRLVLKKLEEAKSEAEKDEIIRENDEIINQFDKLLNDAKYRFSKERLEKYQKMMRETDFFVLTEKHRLLTGQTVFAPELMRRLGTGGLSVDKFIEEIESTVKLIQLEGR